MKKALKIGAIILASLLGLALVLLFVAFMFIEFYPGIGKTPDKAMRKSFEQKTELFYNKQFHNENTVEVLT